jgi:hypothetical protein
VLIQTNGLAVGHAIQIGHAEIQKHEVSGQCKSFLESFFAIGSRMDNKPLGCEHFLKEVLHVGIVLNDEYRLVAHVKPTRITAPRPTEP